MQKRRVLLFSILFCLLTLAAFFVQLSVDVGEGPLRPIRLLPLTLFSALVAAALFYLYPSWLWDEKPFGRASLWVLSALFAGIMTLGQSFAAVGTTELLTGSGAALAKAGVFWAGRVPLYYALMWVLTRWLRLRAELPAAGEEPPPKQRRLARFFTDHPRALWPMLTAALLLCWLPYYILTFPGVVSNDSVTQLSEIFGVTPLSNGNPVFQTFLIWLCCQVMQPLFGADGAVALYCTGQGLVMALLLGSLLTQMVRAKAPRWLCLFSFLLYALCPIFPLYAFCMGKDTNFAMAVLFFTLMVWQVLRLPQGERTPLRYTLGLCLGAALVLVLRNPGVYLAALTLLLVLLWALFARVNRGSRRAVRRWAAPTAALSTLLVLYAGLHLLALPSLQALPMPETEEYSIPLQQVARVVASQPESLTQPEIDTISRVMAYDEIKAAYNGELSDPVKLLWKETATQAEKQDFFRLWLGLGAKNPATYFSATFHNTYGYLCPGYVSTIKPTLLIGKQKRTTDIDPYFSYSVNASSDALKATMDFLLQLPLPRLFMAPGLYGWLVLYGVVTLAWAGGRRRRAQTPLGDRRLLIAAFPALFTLVGCLFSAVNGYFRYAMPLYFSGPLLLFLCSQALPPREALSPEAPAQPKEEPRP